MLFRSDLRLPVVIGHRPGLFCCSASYPKASCPDRDGGSFLLRTPELHQSPAGAMRNAVTSLFAESPRASLPKFSGWVEAGRTRQVMRISFDAYEADPGNARCAHRDSTTEQDKPGSLLTSPFSTPSRQPRSWRHFQYPRTKGTLHRKAGCIQNELSTRHT